MEETSEIVQNSSLDFERNNFVNEICCHSHTIIQCRKLKSSWHTKETKLISAIKFDSFVFVTNRVGFVTKKFNNQKIIIINKRI